MVLLWELESPADPKHVSIRMAEMHLADVPRHIRRRKCDLQPGGKALPVRLVHVVHPNRHPDALVVLFVSVLLGRKDSTLLFVEWTMATRPLPHFQVLNPEAAEYPGYFEKQALPPCGFAAPFRKMWASATGCRISALYEVPRGIDAAAGGLWPDSCPRGAK